MSVDKKVPEIRFEGFSGEWDVKKLGQVYDFNYGEFNNNPSNGGQYPVYGANGIIGGYTRFNAESSAVIGHMGEYAGSVLWAEGKHFVTYNGTIAKPKESDFNALFGYFKLVKMNLKKICGGSGQPFLSYDALERLDFVFPSKKEQTQIGNYFQKLDSLINQHQQKHDKLSNIKKAMLEKMFPKQGETTPEIRFKGFSGEWRTLTLGELGSVAMNKRIFKHETSITGEVPFYKIGTFGSKPDAFISKALFDDYKAKYPYPETGDLLLSASGSIGQIVEYKGEEQYFQDSNIVWLKHDGKIDNLFLKVFYSIVRWSGLEGSTIKRLYNKNILETKILLPEREEQAAIGNYFQKLDSLINQHQQQITKLNNIKQACLSKMFV